MNERIKGYSDLKGHIVTYIVDDEHKGRWDLTNPSRIFKIKDTHYMLVREQQKLKRKLDNLPAPGRSQVALYKLESELGTGNLEFSRVKTLSSGPDDWTWKEDPAISKVNGEWIVTVVECTPEPLREGERAIYHWRTHFHKLNENSLELEKKFFAGPEGMKDIRLFERPNGKIAVLTRPKGVIGYFEVDALDELTKDQFLSGRNIFDATPFDRAFPKVGEEFGRLWVGGNDVLTDEAGSVVVDSDNTIIVFAHVGSMKPGPYVSFCFELNLDTLEHGKITYLSDISHFGEVPDGDVRPNTVFTGGACLLENKDILVTSGLNDIFTGFVTIKTSSE